MKIGTMMITAGVVALGLAAWNTPSNAQGPMYDRVNVNLPYSVTVGERTLQPGDYVIQQLRDNGGGSRVLLIYSDKGMKFETSAMTIPALDQNTPESTKVVLHHFGNDYYFDKVWIQGKDYGYEFPVPDSVKARERERMQPISVAATYSTVQQTDSSTTSTTTTNTTTSAVTTQGTTSAAAADTATTTARSTTPAATTQSTPSPAATTQSTTTAQADTTQSPATTSSTLTAQNQTTSQPSTTQSRTTMQPSTMAPATSRSTATDSGSADRAMPNTSAGWLMMLLGGGALSGAGLSLRRKR